MTSRNFVGMAEQRERYSLPSLNLSDFTDHRRITYIGCDDDIVQGVRIDLSGMTFTLTWTDVLAGVGTGHGGVKLFDFDTGNVTVLNAIVSGTATTGASSGASEALIMSMGTAVAADPDLGDHTDGDDVLAPPSTGNIILGTSNSVSSRIATVLLPSYVPTTHNGAGSAKSVYLNFAQADNVTDVDSSVTFGSGSFVTVYYLLSRP